MAGEDMKDIRNKLSSLGLNDLKVDEFAKEILDTNMDNIEKWQPIDIANAVTSISRHALVVKLELNRLMGLIEYYKFKKTKSHTDDDISQCEYRLNKCTIQRNCLFNIPEMLTEYSNSLKKLLASKESEIARMQV